MLELRFPDGLFDAGLDDDEAVIEVLMHELQHVGFRQLPAATAHDGENHCLPALQGRSGGELLEQVLDDGEVAVKRPGVLRLQTDEGELDCLVVQHEDALLLAVGGDEGAECLGQAREGAGGPLASAHAEHRVGGDALTTPHAAVAGEAQGVELPTHHGGDRDCVLQLSGNEFHDVLLDCVIRFYVMISGCE